jgi:hypothetical protein
VRPAVGDAVRAGLVYFLLVFAAGWVLGPLRELLLVPAIGRTLAVLAEAPLLILALVLASRWTVRRLAVPATVGARAGMGLVALALLLAAELAGGWLVRGEGVVAWAGKLATPAGAIGLALVLLCAAIPVVVGRRDGIGHA